ncbi:hypothetical protein [Arcicella rigui]|uniref:Uncharacterized protein n=1 Tax=Arcicella rigui TaxID=797020 RepID=A0ABU5QGH5_9BACT|nr:hypothetical protein [Arcicella rigui]MEA5141936.1 hypothetical protein [Arcicella rigui]
MEYRRTEVYNFFLVLEQYALGDLRLLHQLAEEAEVKDAETEEENSNFLPTTMYPYGFEFNFGKPVNCRATIPFALMIFSCMDILGFVVRGGNHKATKKNIEEFYKFISPPPSQDELDCLVNLFRHGLAHNYFPKLGQSISYHSKNPSTLFFSDSLGNCLNVNLLEEHFMEGFRNIKANESLYSTMEANFVQLNNHYITSERCNLLASR